nr:hypothetical protein Iba_chr13cCG1730 [Ipomoea batatas]
MEITASPILKVPDDDGRRSMMPASFRLSYSGREITEKNGETSEQRFQYSGLRLEILNSSKCKLELMKQYLLHYHPALDQQHCYCLIQEFDHLKWRTGSSSQISRAV